MGSVACLHHELRDKCANQPEPRHPVRQAHLTEITRQMTALEFFSQYADN